jgi:two-component system sensor histidine kinase ChvG
MASDTVTATHSVAGPRLTTEHINDGVEGAAETRAVPRRATGVSPLTRRILAVNVIALIVLGVALFQLGGYQQGLVDTELAALKTRAQLFAAALGEGAVLEAPSGSEALQTEVARQMIRRMVEPPKRRARVFDTEGRLIIDTTALDRHGGIQVTELAPPQTGGWIARTFAAASQLLTQILPSSYEAESSLPLESPGNYPEVRLAINGDVADAVRRSAEGGLVLSVAVPIQHYRQVLGALLLSSNGIDVEQTVRGVRLTILEAFAIAFVITVLLSLYLAGTIARPLRRLADAAERIRRGHGRQEPIPAFTRRHDEIGDLARALRDMTGALWQRMDATERFAADVAHEIKNPLSSVRSAIETAVRISDPEKRQKLLLLVLDDIERLTRLINDISDASRLDAELSRQSAEKVHIGRLLRAMAEVDEATRPGGVAPHIELERPAGANSAPDLTVIGHEDRLVQVFRNILANATSFSPPQGVIRIAASRQSGYVVVGIEDEGPGIPPGKLDAIFERFYSERPFGEKFGTHSGLGLSISKQIVESHHGTIRAENRVDAAGTVVGARFIIRLPVA